MVVELGLEPVRAEEQGQGTRYGGEMRWGGKGVRGDRCECGEEKRTRWGRKTPSGALLTSSTDVNNELRREAEA